ncbi:MAG: PLP-dependent aminotransferase family protein [Peptococcaceae bacterium]
MLEFSLAFDKESATPLYLQLYGYIKNEIITGMIEPFTKLPSIRELSRALQVSKTTIEAAYQQLDVEGYIVSKAKVGYFANKIAGNRFNFKKGTIDQVDEEAESRPKQQYDMKNDYLDKESFDFSLWKKYLTKSLMYNNERFLTYGSHQGEPELRGEIARYIHQSRGVVCSPENIVIGSGVQTLLGILCGLLKNFHESVGFEDPGFKQARHIFKDHNFNIIPIKLEEDGIDVGILAASRAKIVYVSPSHQFPMGAVMPINKRIQLLNWAHENNGYIIEDDYDSELRYSGRPIPSLQGLSKGANVIYLGIFSKILLPAIRISYMVLPADLLKKYQEQKKKYNQTSSQIEQMALALFMQEGMLAKHIRKLRKIYAQKNEVLVGAVHRIMAGKVDILGAESGLHILLELKTQESPDDIALLAEKVGVKVIPINNYYLGNTQDNYPLVLLSYGGIALEHIEPAINLLHKVWFQKS